MDETAQKTIEQRPLETEEEINLLELLQVLVRRRALIIGLTLATAVVAVIVSLLLPNIYTATAKILPPQKEGGGGGAAALLAQLGGGVMGGLAGLGGTSDLYIGILKSRSVTDTVITRLNLQQELEIDNPDRLRTTVQNLLKVQSDKKDGMISISADYKDPRKAALLVNTFVDELQRKTTQLNLTKAGTERQFLEQRLTVVRVDLKKAEEDLRIFQEKSSTLKADDQAKAAIESIAKLQAQIITTEVQLSAARQNLTDEAPEVRALLASLAQLKKQLAIMTGVSGAGGGIPSIGSAPAIGVEYFRKLRELKTQEALFEQLTKQYELAKLSEARDVSSLQVLDEAVVPTMKSKPKRSQIVILATVTAFFCSILLAFIKEYLAKMSAEDAAILHEMKGELQTSFQQLRSWLPGARKGSS